MTHALNRRRFLQTLAASAAAAAMPRFLRAAGTKPRPNFVFFLIDDLGWMDLSCQGSKFYETPNIDRLARGGMRFTDAYAACPVCSPTRASIMTGQYPARLHLTDFLVGRRWPADSPIVPIPDWQKFLPLEEVTLAEALKESGYATFFAGKWHLGPEGFWPENQGFDVNKGGGEHGGPYGGKKYFSPYGNPRLEDGPPGEHLPLRLGRETADFIEAHKDGPFLAYLAFYSVHIPLMTTKELEAKYQAKAKDAPETRWGQEGERKVRLVQNHAVYAGMVEAMDTAVGIVLDRLDRLGLAENTAVFFMSDNGGLSTSEGHPTTNLPLRAGKGWLYEGGVREPMIVRAPGVTRPGSACAEPLISTDFYPTMLELAGLPLRPDQHADGTSFVSLLEGEKMTRGPIYWHYPHYGNMGFAPAGAVRDGDWKLLEFYEDGRLELYNLKDDLGEQKDLGPAMPEKARELRKMLADWRKTVGAQMPTPNPNYQEGPGEKR